jgi:hypothetical protein
MYVVFQTETGGNLMFDAVAIDSAISGYIDVVASDRTMYRFDGTVTSGYLLVSRSGVSSSLTPGQYTLLPQVVDNTSRVFFLSTAELQIVEVPDFFSPSY